MVDDKIHFLFDWVTSEGELDIGNYYHVLHGVWTNSL